MKVKAILSLFILIFLICGVLQRCKKSTTALETGCSPFTGITETNEVANIIGNTDPDDWKDSGFLYHLLAYPNPFDRSITIGYYLNSSANVTITVNKDPNQVIRTIFVDQPHVPGGYTLTWDSKNESGDEVPDCIYRIYFTATTDNGTEKTYGDIELKRYNE